MLFAGRPIPPAALNRAALISCRSPYKVVALGSHQAALVPVRLVAQLQISDPKTVTVTGAMRNAAAQRDIENTIFLDRLKHRSRPADRTALEERPTAEDCRRQISLGSGSSTGSEAASYSYYAPVRLGYRRIPFDRWIATPLYLLRLLDTKNTKPVEVKRQGYPDEPEDFTGRRRPEIRIDRRRLQLALTLRNMVLELNTMKGQAVTGLIPGC